MLDPGPPGEDQIIPLTDISHQGHQNPLELRRVRTGYVRSGQAEYPLNTQTGESQTESPPNTQTDR